MKKFAAILAAVMVLCSVVFVSAYAAPIGDSSDSGLIDPVTQDPVTPPVDMETSPIPLTLPAETFPALPLLEKQYYSYSVPLSRIPGYAADAISVSSFSFFVDDSYVAGGSGEISLLYRSFDSSSHRYFINFGGVDYFLGTEWDSISNGTVILYSSSSSLVFNSGVTISGTLVESDPVSELADDLFSVGDALIGFVISSWVVLLPLAAWLVVLCIGAIRKLIKGV